MYCSLHGVVLWGALCSIGARCSLHGKDRASVTSSFISLQMETIHAQCGLSVAERRAQRIHLLYYNLGLLCRSGCHGEHPGRIPGAVGQYFVNLMFVDKIVCCYCNSRGLNIFLGYLLISLHINKNKCVPNKALTEIQ